MLDVVIRNDSSNKACVPNKTDFNLSVFNMIIGWCWCKYKKRHVCDKDDIWNLSKCSCDNGKY